MGASVVAVEPNPELAARLRKRFRNIPVIEKAIASEDGEATLHLGTDSNYSTISNTWRAVVEARGRLSDSRVTVSVTTLESLIAQFGSPHFIKIDVEGSELEAIQALRTPIDGLVFEYQCPLFEDFAGCVRAIQALAHYEFGLEIDGVIHWHDAPSVLTRVHAACDEGIGSGEIYVRRV